MLRFILAFLWLVAFLLLEARSAKAQTAADTNEGARLRPDLTIDGHILSWWGQTGRTYFLQHSDDLLRWNYLPVIEPGANRVVEWAFSSSNDKFFLRLRLSDIPAADPFQADFDGDKVGNWNELTQGTDPLSFLDIDSDGLPDDWEKHRFGNLGLSASGDQDGDGFSNLAEFQHGTDPTNAADHPYDATQLPVIARTHGDNQSSLAGETLMEPLMVEVRGNDGNPQANVPVRFSVTSGGGFMATAYGATPTLSTVNLVTDELGIVGVLYRNPAQVGIESQIRCEAGSGGNLAVFVFRARTAGGTIPSNDNLANATNLSATASGNVTASSPGATKEADEPNHAVQGNSAKSVWFRWTAPAGGPVVFKTQGSSFDTILAIYTGSAVSNLVLVGKNDDATENGTFVLTSRVAFVASAGTSYAIAVDGEDGQTGEITLAWASPTGPANDLFLQAQTLTASAGGLATTNIGATKEHGEPNHAKQPGNATLWYRWQAPTDGACVVSTAGSGFDTLLGIYTGNRIDQLTEVAANDNEGINLNTSRVQFRITAGTSYFFAVDGYSGRTGTVQLAWNLLPPPANDNFASATFLSGNSGQVELDTSAATVEAQEPDHGGQGTCASVWYVLQPTIDTFVSLQVRGTDAFQPLWAVYTGEQLSNLDQQYAFEGFYAYAGETYRIVVYGVNQKVGAATLNWNFDASGWYRFAKRASGPTNQDLSHNHSTTTSDEEECEDPSEPNKGDAGVWSTDENGESVFLSSQSVFISVPGNLGPGGATASCTQEVPVTHRIVTTNTPRARDLPGKLKLNLISGDASALEVTYNGSPYTLGTEIGITEYGHSGCLVHDWHTGTEIFGFKGKKGGVVVLEAVVDPDPDDGGDGEPDQKLTITVTILKVTFKAKPGGLALPYEISAKTDWGEQESVTRQQQITVETEPAGFAPSVALEVEGLDPAVNPSYQPGGVGTIRRAGGATWTYEAFTEPRSEKRPQPKVALVRARIGEHPLCVKHKVNISSVFQWLAWSPHAHGADGTRHVNPLGADRVDDRFMAAKYVVWKYSVPTGNIRYSYALRGPKSDIANAITLESGSVGSKPVLIYPGSYISENWLASTIGHENVHGGQTIPWWMRSNGYRILTGGKWYRTIEYPAYQWQVDTAAAMGLTESETESVISARDNTKDGLPPLSGGH